MIKKMLVAMLILLIVFSAGCAGSDSSGAAGNNTTDAGTSLPAKKIAPLEGVEASVAGDAANADATGSSGANTSSPTIDCGPWYLLYKQYKKDGFSEKGAVALTHECVKTYVPTGDEVPFEGGVAPSAASTDAADTGPATDFKTEVLAYLANSTIKSFEDLGSRIILATKTGTGARITYTTSTADPGQESVYLCGVALILDPALKKVNTSGYNAEGKEIEAGIKYFIRDKYNFNNYRVWFPDYVYNECKTDAECDDNNNCTKDFCKESKCYNSQVVVSGC